MYGVQGPEGMSARQFSGVLDQHLIELNNLQQEPAIVETASGQGLTSRL